MENTKRSDLRLRKKALKAKLMSALALLLVATIMMGTSTYAWFVLSTAPEVKGMSTTVGANGSLEIALQDTEVGDSGEYTGNRKENGTGNSYVLDTISVIEANKTWGNIVDLSDPSYGFATMKLYPTQLKLTDAGNVDTTSPLVTARYGVDGRVATVDKNLTTGLFVDEAFVPGFGVRGIGDYAAAEGNEQSLLRSTLVARANSEIDTRRSALATNLGAVFNSNLLTLSNVGSKDDAETLSTAETNAVLAILNSVKTQAEAMRQALGFALMGQRATGDYDFNNDFAAGESKTPGVLYAKYRDMTIDELIAAGVAEANSLKATLDNLDAQIAAVTNSANANEGQANAGVAKTAVNAAMRFTVLTMVYDDGTGVQREGWDALGSGAAAKLTRIQEIVNDYPGAYAVLPSGAGAMAELAALAGDYSFTLSAAGLSVQVYVTTDSADAFDKDNPAAGSLAALQAAFNPGVTGEAFKFVPTGSVGTTYGLAIDLAFRTNSAGNLLLSTAISRVSNTTDAGVMGSGSTVNFNNDELNAAVYVVFIDTDSGEIYGVAKHDGTAANNLVMMQFDVQNGALVLGAAKGDNVITALTGDMQPKYITAIIFLDGSATEESYSVDVAGTLNLQFASSAQLTPMDYDDYVGGAGGGGGEGGGGGGEGGGGTGGGETQEQELTISLYKTDADIVTLTASQAPAGAAITWSSSADNIVYVDTEGKLYGMGAGTATVTASWDGGSQTWTVTVTL